MTNKRKAKKRVQLGIRAPLDVQKALHEAAEWYELPVNTQAVRYLEHCLAREGFLDREVQLDLLE